MGCRVTIHLIRHAPTRANIERRYIGWTDMPLANPENLQVIDGDVQEVIGSDLLRCQQTSEIYFPQANFTGLPDLREMNFGDFEFKSYEDLQYNANYHDWIDRPFEVKPPNGEAFETFRKRVMEGFHSIDVKDEQYFVLHGGVIRLLLMTYAPEEKEFWEWTVSHDQQFTLTWDDASKLKEGKRCTSLSVAPITAK